jgi:hypothetical protein
VGDVPEDVEVGDQGVVDAFEDGEIHDPSGLRGLADPAVTHVGVVRMTKDVQQRVPIAMIAIPHPVQRGSQAVGVDLVVGVFPGVEVLLLLDRIPGPERSLWTMVEWIGETRYQKRPTPGSS